MEEVRAKEEAVEEVTKIQEETTTDRTVETVTEVDVKEVVSAEVESDTSTGETVADAAEEVIETKEEVVTTSDGTIVEEEAEQITIDQAMVVEDNSEGVIAVASEKTEEAVDAAAYVVSESTALPITDTIVGESSGVAADSVQKEENVAIKGSEGNQETSEIPRSTEDQQSENATARTRTSWTNCCGLLDLVKH